VKILHEAGTDGGGGHDAGDQEKGWKSVFHPF
jgi:hypothetical protein